MCYSCSQKIHLYRMIFITCSLYTLSFAVSVAPPMSHDCAPPVAAASRRFLRLPAHGGIFDSQSVTGAGSDTTLYQPVGDNLLVNVALVDQISFSQGTYFVADTDGTYLRSEAGQCLRIVRRGLKSRRMVITL